MLTGLYALTASEGIGVEFALLPRPLLGLYDYRPGEPPFILLHNKLQNDRKLLRCVFAEELGHHFTGVGNLMAFTCTDNKCTYSAQKYERLALWWAIEYLTPLDKIIQAGNSGIFLTWELAEYFDVTERFMGTSLKLYFEKGEIKLSKKLSDCGRDSLNTILRGEGEW